MVSYTDVLAVYQKRDKAAIDEQALEDEIFSPTKVRTAEEASAICKRYQQSKDRRAHWSVEAARLFMQLEPEDKAKVTAEWRNSQEGKRKAKGTGIRGK
jgi:hypothetical protein